MTTISTNSAVGDWTQKRLGDVCRPVGGGTPSRSQPKYWNGNIPWASVKDFTDESVVLEDTQEHITRDGLESSASTLVERNIPVVCTRMAVGRCALTTRPTAINQDLKALILSGEFEPRFFIRLLRHHASDLDRVSIGSTVRGISTGDLLKLTLSYPKRPEQTRIASALDTVDDTIAKTEAVIAKLRQVRAGLLYDLLTCGLDSHGQLRDPIAHPEQFQDSALGRIPKGWTIETLESCCSEVVDCPHSTPNYLAVGVLVARTMHIRDGRYDVESSSRVTEVEYVERIGRLRPRPGDVIFTREAPVGEAFVIPLGMRICLGQRVMLLRPRGDKLTGGYMVAQIYSGAVRQRVDCLTGGTTNPHLNVAEVRKFTVPLPEVDEQKRIETCLSAHDALLESETAQLNKLRQLKSGLMTDLLTGCVRVPVEPVVTWQT